MKSFVFSTRVQNPTNDSPKAGVAVYLMLLCGCEKYINSEISSVEKHTLSRTKL